VSKDTKIIMKEVEGNPYWWIDEIIPSGGIKEKSDE